MAAYSVSPGLRCDKTLEYGQVLEGINLLQHPQAEWPAVTLPPNTMSRTGSPCTQSC